jgi:Histidine kinase-like ATPase domain
MQVSSGSADVADRTRQKSRRSSLELAVLPSAVRVARHWTADQLVLAGPAGRILGEELIDTAVLMVSELVTNAIRAVTIPSPPRRPGRPITQARRILSYADLPLTAMPTAPEVWLVLARSAVVIRIEVHDSSPAPLRQAKPGRGDAESGRGLTVVAALARRWGWQPEPPGKMVWCELAC